MSLREAIEEGARLILESKPLPPCGTKNRPHLVHPKSPIGKLTHCASCGETWLFEGFAATRKGAGRKKGRK